MNSNRASHHTNHRILGIAVRTNQIADFIGKDQKWHAEQHNPSILLGKCISSKAVQKRILQNTRLVAYLQQIHMLAAVNAKRRESIIQIAFGEAICHR